MRVASRIERDLGRRLHLPHLVEHDVEIDDLGLERDRLDLLAKHRLLRLAAVPRIGGRRALVRADAIGRDGANRFFAERQVDVAPLAGDRLERGVEAGAIDDGLDAGDLLRLVTRREQRAFRTIVGRRARRQEQRRALRAPVDQENRARHLDAGEIEELFVLLELLVVGLLGGASDDRHAVANGRHHLRPPRRKLRRRHRVGEQPLIGRDRREQDE